MRRWLLILYQVPSEPSARRVYVWRKLKRLGALLLHDGAWVLPGTARTREQLQWLAAEIDEMGGSAQVWDSVLAYGQEEALVQQFLAQSEAAYQALLLDLEQTDGDLAALSRRHQQAQSQDHFGAPSGHQVRERLLERRGGEAE